MGAPANLSKKGAQMHNLGKVAEATEELAPARMLREGVAEPTHEGMVAKRTEYLEQRVRALTSMLQERQNDHDAMRERLELFEQRSGSKMDQLFENAQWLYAKTTSALRGVDVDGGCLQATLARYRGGEYESASELLPAGSWVLLAYPMEQAEVNGETQVLMKMRKVDKNTGQLGYAWAIISQERDGCAVRNVGEFSLTPYAIS